MSARPCVADIVREARGVPGEWLRGGEPRIVALVGGLFVNAGQDAWLQCSAAPVARVVGVFADAGRAACFRRLVARVGGGAHLFDEYTNVENTDDGWVPAAADFLAPSPLETLEAAMLQRWSSISPAVFGGRRSAATPVGIRHAPGATLRVPVRVVATAASGRYTLVALEALVGREALANYGYFTVDDLLVAATWLCELRDALEADAECPARLCLAPALNSPPATHAAVDAARRALRQLLCGDWSAVHEMFVSKDAPGSIPPRDAAIFAALLGPRAPAPQDELRAADAWAGLDVLLVRAAAAADGPLAARITALLLDADRPFQAACLGVRMLSQCVYLAPPAARPAPRARRHGVPPALDELVEPARFRERVIAAAARYERECDAWAHCAAFSRAAYAASISRDGTTALVARRTADGFVEANHAFEMSVAAAPVGTAVDLKSVRKGNVFSRAGAGANNGSFGQTAEMWTVVTVGAAAERVGVLLLNEDYALGAPRDVRSIVGAKLTRERVRTRALYALARLFHWVLDSGRVAVPNYVRLAAERSEYTIAPHMFLSSAAPPAAWHIVSVDDARPAVAGDSVAPGDGWAFAALAEYVAGWVRPAPRTASRHQHVVYEQQAALHPFAPPRFVGGDYSDAFVGRARRTDSLWAAGMLALNVLEAMGGAGGPITTAQLLAAGDVPAFVAARAGTAPDWLAWMVCRALQVDEAARDAVFVHATPPLPAAMVGGWDAPRAAHPRVADRRLVAAAPHAGTRRLAHLVALGAAEVAWYQEAPRLAALPPPPLPLFRELRTEPPTKRARGAWVTPLDDPFEARGAEERLLRYAAALPQWAAHMLRSTAAEAAETAYAPYISLDAGDLGDMHVGVHGDETYPNALRLDIDAHGAALLDATFEFVAARGAYFVLMPLVVRYTRDGELLRGEGEGLVADYDTRLFHALVECGYLVESDAGYYHVPLARGGAPLADDGRHFLVGLLLMRYAWQMIVPPRRLAPWLLALLMAPTVMPADFLWSAPLVAEALDNRVLAAASSMGVGRAMCVEMLRAETRDAFLDARERAVAAFTETYLFDPDDAPPAEATALTALTRGFCSVPGAVRLASALGPEGAIGAMGMCVRPAAALAEEVAAATVLRALRPLHAADAAAHRACAAGTCAGCSACLLMRFVREHDTPDTMRRFLRAVTATERLPSSAHHIYYRCDTARGMPWAQTCARLIMLPAYPDGDYTRFCEDMRELLATTAYDLA